MNMISKSQTLFTILLVISIPLSGCLSSDEEQLEEFPLFNLVDEQGNEHTNSMYSGEPFVAYVSASWCNHCKPALEALDDTVPEGHVLVFNKDGRERYSDMNEWKDRMESELERNLSHPFIHAPELSQALNVSGIPAMFFVNSDGIIEYTTSGVKDKSTIETHWNDLS